MTYADDTSEITGQQGDEDKKPEPRSAKPYLEMLEESRKAFEEYQDKADRIDKLYANLAKQANPNRDREFALFWANIQTQTPAIYSRPAVPVVVPRFKDRRPLLSTTSELLERCASCAVEKDNLHGSMRLVRDDLAIQARGVLWCRLETKGKGKYKAKACIEHVDRADFRHSPSRKWKEVGWAAKRSWLTRKEMRERFHKHSGDVYKDAVYSVQKDDKERGAADGRQKAGVWEIWHRTENKVCWVAPGCEKVLDEGEPHLDLEDFFPCPEPAYGTVQRRSLIPVPDFAFYKDQLEEINELTARISALTEAVKVRGFYPAGAGEIGDAIETAIKSLSNNQIMVPVSNWAMFGNGGAKDMIVWLPIDMIVETISALVELRRQIIDDVYQITGLSDIMRGETDPDETLGAQELKSQFGAIRIRSKQEELVRIARDAIRIVAEIMAENFPAETLLAISQMEIPSEADLKRQEQEIIAAAGQQVQAAMRDPQMMQQAQQNPQMAEQLLEQMEQQVQGEIEKLRQQPTIEQVMSLLRDEKLRPYSLDIETDSTIQADENAEKQLRNEFLTALGGTMQQLGALVEQDPGAATFAGEILKFAVSPYRVGRSLDQAIDDYIEQLKARGPQQQQVDPAAEAKAREIEGKMEIERAKMEMQMQAAQMKAEGDIAKIRAEMERDAMRHAQELEKGQIEIQKLAGQIESIKVKVAADIQKAQIATATAEMKAGHDAQKLQQQSEIAESSAQQQASIREREASQRSDQSERDFQQKSAIADKAAAKGKT